MMPRDMYVQNLMVCSRPTVSGAIVECGTWRGGMIAGIASLLGPSRQYVLFDSFEGLPEAKAIDGPAAAKWQSDSTSTSYYDNCRAELAEAESAMRLAGIGDAQFRKGWFDSTVPSWATQDIDIAVLRLDGDWFDSTIVCLRHLFPLVVPGGVIVIDDYGNWEGCTRAVHQYLAETSRPEPIRRTSSGVTYLIKASSIQ